MARGMEEVAASSLEDQFAELESGEEDLEVEARLAELKGAGAGIRKLGQLTTTGPGHAPSPGSSRFPGAASASRPRTPQAITAARRRAGRSGPPAGSAPAARPPCTTFT